ncbi:MAG: ornithine carbamoyltransferase, partial [Ferrimicrobium sp.]
GGVEPPRQSSTGRSADDVDEPSGAGASASAPGMVQDPARTDQEWRASHVAPEADPLSGEASLAAEFSVPTFFGSDRFVGATMAGVFEHPSLRTRSAFAGAAYAVGALPVFFVGDEIGIDTRESAEDVAHLLCEHHQLIGARLRSHDTFVRMAEVAMAYGRPMVNLLTDWAHPTQALADLITIVEHLGVEPGAPLPSLRIAYLGDANNVARSLTKAAIAVGWDITIAAPNGHQFGVEDVASFATYRKLCGTESRVELTDDPSAAVREARVLYTDVWVSMGETGTTEPFEGFAIDEELLLSAPADAFVMHCLPAHRGMEIAASVIDSERSVVWAQARNRLVAMERLFRLISEED